MSYTLVPSVTKHDLWLLCSASSFWRKVGNVRDGMAVVIARGGADGLVRGVCRILMLPPTAAEAHPQYQVPQAVRCKSKKCEAVNARVRLCFIENLSSQITSPVGSPGKWRDRSFHDPASGFQKRCSAEIRLQTSRLYGFQPSAEPRENPSFRRNVKLPVKKLCQERWDVLLAIRKLRLEH